MAIEGHCNCKSITVSIPSLPAQSVICSCSNCQRAGAAPFSINYFFAKSEVDIKDPQGVLKEYRDGDTKSGNIITRKFCGNCGSPVVTESSPDAPKIVVKSTVFGEMPPPAFEYFPQDCPTWLKISKAGQEEAKV